MIRRVPTFVDLFAGCGGMALGLMQAGWRGLFAVEKNPMAFETLEANFLSSDTNARRVAFDWPEFLPRRPLAVEDLLAGQIESRLRELEHRVDLVSGGPPCQGFSFSGRRKQEDPRNRLIHAYADFVLRVKPKLLVVENVPGILVPHGKKWRDLVNPGRLGRPPKSYAQKLAELLQDDYVFRNGVVDAAGFGVPQRRKRFFGVGILRAALPDDVVVVENSICRLNGDVVSPAPELDPFCILETNRLDFLKAHGLGSTEITAAAAINDFSPGRADRVRPCMDPQSPRGFEELAYDPPPHNALSPYVRLMRAGLNGTIPDSLRLARHSPAVQKRFQEILAKCPRGVRLNEADRERYSTTLKHRIVPLAHDKPSHTLTTLPDDIIHYSKPRILTVREYARLQSFPDWFVFRGKYTTGGSARRRECPRYTQVGNAVPPLLAEAWGQALLSVLHTVGQHQHS